MTFPPVVSDPEGVCPGRLVLASDPEPFTRHDWEWGYSEFALHGVEYLVKVCCFCGGRKP